ncbi:heterokaryon incompatibility [Podospora didyma]|uniref:Heterokaryon incompatibility n=1 Tax=Podospora didyma TaxID=330526 RepID=A0AAE0NUI7_9PEZI|nr:heterokaryon incompatibility [Podospora didyma]
MECVSLIGKRYLWVDRFCIVQHDHASKQVQIHDMAFVYGNAYFTIVAAGASNAREGLRGIEGVSEGFLSPDPVYHNRYNIEELDHDQLISSSPWNGRGWSLQELVFSQRCLFFHKSNVT